MRTLRILLTNDDGVHAPGLRALVAGLGHLAQVSVVAPSRDKSGVGHAISLATPLRCKTTKDGWMAVSGTPADCVYLAVHELLPERPDLVVSGINRGPNLADDVIYSGTVAGAMEGALMDIPAMAVSLAGGRSADYRPAAHFAASVAEWMLKSTLPERTLLNVNVPDTDGAAVSGYRWTRLGLRDYGRCVTRRTDPRGAAYYWLGGREIGSHSLEGSDCDAIGQGVAAITPLRIDATDQALLSKWRGVELAGLELR